MKKAFGTHVHYTLAHNIIEFSKWSNISLSLWYLGLGIWLKCGYEWTPCFRGSPM